MKLRGMMVLALAVACAPAMAQTNPGTSPLSGSKGGTGNAFMQFTGPAASMKTFTLPNVSDTIVLLTQAQTLTNKTLTSPTIDAVMSAGVTQFLNGASAARIYTGGVCAAAAYTDCSNIPTNGVFSKGDIAMAGSTSGLGTLKAPAAASIYVWTLPTATDTLVGRATTDTLTHKTFDTAGSGNSLLINGLAATANTGTGAVVRATSPALTTPDLGTPSAATLTNATGLPVSTGISGFASGIATFLASPSSANLRAALTDETGAGAAYFAGGALGTPSSATLTNATGLPVSTGISGLGAGVASWLATPSSANLASAVTDETGSGAAVFGTSPTLGGLVNFSGARRDSAQSTPAQITANQNDYNPSSVVCSSSSTLVINSDAARDITGIGGGLSGCDLFLFNNGSFPITLKDGSASSTAANRFDLGADFILASKAAAHLKYDGSASRWRNTTGSGSGSGGGGTVTSVQVSGGTGISVSGTCTITTSGACTVAQVTPAFLSALPSDPAGTTSSSQIMLGFGVSSCRITPAFSGRLQVTVYGAWSNTSGGAISAAHLRYGSGAGPAYGAAVTGTQFTASPTVTTPSGGYREVFSLGGLITGLTPGTTYWIDMVVNTTTGTLSVFQTQCVAVEF